ncbi:MAG: hypothetical protein AAFR14_10195 [Bacteroidota bacterium]
MIRIGIIALASFAMVITSCQTTENKKTAETANDETVFPTSIQKGGYNEELASIRAQALTLISDRIENSDGPLAMLTVGYWYPEFVFNAGKMSQVDQYKGYWIKYNDDFTYSYGQYGDVHGGGRYHFTLDNNSLLMLDNNVDQEPKSWIANHNGEAMAYVGQHDWDVNNGMQIKMLPLDNIPPRG